MSQLDPLFALYPLDGLQDIWFFDLEPARVVALYEFASGERYPGKSGLQELQDVSCQLAPFVFDGAELSGIAIRIEHGNLAIDFDSGLEYWTDSRQHAFIGWLRTLRHQTREVRLVWAHEGADHQASPVQTGLLRRAVNEP